MITKVVVTPSRSTRYLKAGEHYAFEHVRNNLYGLELSIEQSGAVEKIVKYEHIDTLTSEIRSPHLWDGKCWDDAGHWEVIDLIETEEVDDEHN